MKRIFTAVCALALLMAGCTPALGDDPSGIPTEDGYTATFGSVEAPGESNAPAAGDPSASVDPDKPSVPFNWAEVKTPLMIGGMVLILAIGGAFAIKKIRRR